MPPKSYLTKSKFKVALECPRKLFYYGKSEYGNINSENEFLQSLAEGGYQVGELAKYYHPGGYEIEAPRYNQPISETNALLQKENVIIYEPAIKYKNFFIRIDILVKTGKKVELIEVKAKSFNSQESSFLNKAGYIDNAWKPYLYDVAFQTWVTEHAFPEWEVEPFLMLADKSKSASVDGLNQLFKITRNDKGRLKIKTTLPKITPEILGDKVLSKFQVRDCVDLIINGNDKNPSKKNEEEVKSFAKRSFQYCDFYIKDKPYPATLGSKCKSCEYKINSEMKSKGFKSGFEECWKEANGEDFNFEKPLIFDLWNYRQNQQMIDQNIFYLKNIPMDSLKGASEARQRLQIEKTCFDANPTENVHPQLFNEINSWTFPLNFIDFETSMVAIPFNKDRSPYEQIAFQFSRHTLHENGTIDHGEFIHTECGTFPNFEFVRELKKQLETNNGTIFRYANHENMVLKKIQEQLEQAIIAGTAEDDFSDLSAWIEMVTQVKDDDGQYLCGKRNMVDLQKQVKEYYYHPLMGGSNSIKAVLPAIMNTSKVLKDKYSKALDFGTNLKGMTLWRYDKEKHKAKDPYKLLPPVFKDIDTTDLDLISESDDLCEGGAAMTAYSRMQFSDMSDTERDAITTALLKYCELDTIAMLMIYEHWKYIERVYSS